MGTLVSDGVMAMQRDDVRHCGGDGESCGGTGSGFSGVLCFGGVGQASGISQSRILTDTDLKASDSD